MESKRGQGIVSLSLSILAANLMILATGPVAGNTKLNQMLPKEEAALTYSVMAASGAFVAAISFVVFGYLSNRLATKRGSRQRIYMMALGLTPLLGYLLSTASTPTAILVIWCLLQLPSAAILSASTLVALERVKPAKMALTSALFGITGVVALLIGSIIGSLANDPTLSIQLAMALATLLLIPAARIRENVILNKDTTKPRGKISFKFVTFLLGVFGTLAAMAVSVDFYLQLVMRISGETATEANPTAYLLSSVSSLAFLISALTVGFITKTQKHASVIFHYSLIALALGLFALGIAGNLPAAICGALLIGFGGGMNFGTQLPVMRDALEGRELLGNQVGIYNLVSVLPGMLVPLGASVLIVLQPNDWTQLLPMVIALFAVLPAALAKLVRIR